ncbi:SDR family NAD(P)-dependent oxidoreductase [Niveibacterium terrae]|uniref:SDR family NAD(P)-dependent oxidoreductase n=1 Tax=Niveibacterium terrae TaxID=3373598 RepID=UPI003A951B51
MTQKTVLIAGASRGLGLEFARQYSIAGWKVLAGVREPARAVALMRVKGVELFPLDVTSAGSLADSAWLADEDPLDLLLVCAGLYGPDTAGFLAPGDADFDAVMRTNVLGPMRVIQTFGDSVAKAGGRIAVLSSAMGSIGASTQTSGLLYRASKAAANMVVKCAALEYGPKGGTVVALHPGWVRTDMGGEGGELDAYTSVRGLRSVIEGLEAQANGGFFDWRGEALPW